MKKCVLLSVGSTINDVTNTLLIPHPLNKLDSLYHEGWHHLLTDPYVFLSSITNPNKKYFLIILSEHFLAAQEKKIVQTLFLQKSVFF